MGQIPMAQELGNQAPRTRQGVAVASGQTAGLDAISRLSQIGADVAINIDRNRRATKVSAATSEAGREIENYVSTMTADDRDYETQFERYTAFVEETDKRYQEHFKDDPRGYSVWKNKFGQFAFKKGFDIRNHSNKGILDLHKGMLDSSMNDLNELYIQGDDEQREMIASEASLQLQEAYDNGVITAEELTNIRIQFEKDITTGVVRKDIMDDPDQAILKLRNGEYQGLPSEDQVRLLESAVRESEARDRKEIVEANRLDREQEKAEKEVQENLSKAGDKLLSNGELTEDWLEENRDDLSDSDYRYFYSKLRNADEGVTDSFIYSDLRTRASNGDDVRAEARTFLQKGQLKLADYEKLVNRSEDNVGVSNLPNSFKRGERYISQALRVSDINPDPAAAQRQADALDDWSQWTNDNPNATNSEARENYQRITKEYALLDHEQMLVSKRLPQFAVGNRQNMDIEASMQATVDAFKSGEIDEVEFNKQATLLKEWEAAKERLEGSN